MMKKSRPYLSRRQFLTTVSIAGVGTALIDPLTAWATSSDIDPRVARIAAGTIGTDTHNHIDVPLTANEVPGPKIELAAEMKNSGLSAICMTFALDYQKIQNPGEVYERFLNGLNSMDQQLKINGVKRSLNITDLHTHHQNKQPTVIQSVEGGHFLEGKLDRLVLAYERGLRHLGLLHDSDASVPLGDVYTNPPRLGGLTPFGVDVIKECNRLGILIDLANADTATLAAALKLTTHPVIISHTGLDTRLGQNPDFARMMKPRLISKEQAKIVADAGGIIGVWTHLADSPTEYAQNIRALVDVIGPDHVCIGTDTKLTQPYRPPGAFGSNPGGQGIQQDSARGKRPDGLTPGGGKGPNGPSQQGGRPGERTNQAWQNQKTGFYYAVIDALLKTGFNEEDIGKIGGGNYCRVFEAVTAGKH